MDQNAKMWNFGEKLDLVALSKQFIVILNKVAQFWNLNIHLILWCFCKERISSSRNRKKNRQIVALQKLRSVSHKK